MIAASLTLNRRAAILSSLIRIRHLVWLCGTALLFANVAHAQNFPQPLPIETIPANATLPAHYPSDWIFAYDLHFSSIVDSRIAIVDVAHPTHNLQAMIRAAQFGTLAQSRTRPEMYVAETFYSRLTQGDRTEAITIYDTSSLKPTGEILLPTGKRAESVVFQSSFDLTHNDRFGLVYNFTPAASVSVVDLVKRSVVNEIPIPGCAEIYPAGEQGFFSLCANGGLIGFDLDDNGKVAHQAELPKFNDIDNNAAFMYPAYGDTAIDFVTFKGMVHQIDTTSLPIKSVTSWSLLSPAEITSGVRPSGWQVASLDGQKRLYVLMQTDGKEGSHKNGGTEIMVFDVAGQKRLKTIKLQKKAQAILVTRGATPRLVASNEEGEIAIYDAGSGQYQQTLAGNIAENPFALALTRP